MNAKLFAFWRYDQFPGVLGGEVIYMNSLGLVRVKGYGSSLFRPIKLLPVAHGRVLMERIEKLRQDHDAAVKKLTKESEMQRDRLIKIPKS